MPANIVGMAHSYNDKGFAKIIEKNKFTMGVPLNTNARRMGGV